MLYESYKEERKQYRKGGYLHLSFPFSLVLAGFGCTTYVHYSRVQCVAPPPISFDDPVIKLKITIGTKPLFLVIKEFM